MCLISLSPYTDTHKQIPISRRKLAPREAKIAWLVTHKSEWKDFPDPNDYSDINLRREIADRVTTGLKLAGLLSLSTNAIDVCIGTLVRDARILLGKTQS